MGELEDYLERASGGGLSNPTFTVPFYIYDSAGNLVATIDVDGFTALGIAANAGALIKVGLVSGKPTITFRPPPIVGHTYADGAVTVGSDATLGAFIDILPPLDAGKLNSELTLWSQGTAAQPPRADFKTDFFKMAGVVLAECDVQNFGISQGRGYKGGCFLTSDSALIGAGETAINFTTGGIIFRAQRVYSIQLAGVFEGTPAGPVVRVRKGQTAAGALVADLGVIPPTGFTYAPGPFYFANTTAADITIDLCATIQASGGNNVRWLGNGNRPSGFTVWDIGDAGAMNGKAPFTSL